MPESTRATCRHCDAALPDDAQFCPQCGHPLPGRRISGTQAVVTGEVDVTLVAELRQEKERLDKALRRLLDVAERRDLNEDEREEWKRTHKLWERVRAALTRQMQYLSARDMRDRRVSDRRSGTRRRQQIAIDHAERRSGAERRTGQQRSGKDRRNPYPTDESIAD